MDNIHIITLGLLAQSLFFMRTIVQWFKSEHKGVVVSPIIFWQISLVASILMLTYGILRNDFSIVIGQSLVYGIYIRNLQLKGAWKSMHWTLRFTSIVVPVAYWFWLVSSGSIKAILYNEEVTLFWVFWGTMAQIIFVSRFFYQWIFSENRKVSVLPLGFWVISATGSLMIFAYGAARLDAVLLMAHVFGLFIYFRNILLHFGKTSLIATIDNSSKTKAHIIRALNKIK